MSSIASILDAYSQDDNYIVSIEDNEEEEDYSEDIVITVDNYATVSMRIDGAINAFNQTQKYCERIINTIENQFIPVIKMLEDMSNITQHKQFNYPSIDELNKLTIHEKDTGIDLNELFKQVEKDCKLMNKYEHKLNKYKYKICDYMHELAVKLNITLNTVHDLNEFIEKYNVQTF